MISSVLASLLIGYVSGSLPWGLWLGRWFRGVDVRTIGSKNLGATNVFRSLGPALGVATLLLDVAKGALPTWLVAASPLGSTFPGGREACAIAVGLAAIAGHVWSFLAGFRGGKGVATTAGVLLALSPPAFAAFLAVFAVTVAITRYISLGSMLGAIAFAVTLAVSARGPSSPATWFGVLAAGLVIARHHENIRRLLRGEERRFSWKRS